MSGFTLIDSVVLESAASAINIPVDTAFRKFRVTVFGIKDGSAGTVQLRVNGDSSTVYAYQDITADSTTADAARVTSAAQIVLTTDNTVAANSASLFTIEIDKPLATTPARVTATSSYMQSTGPAINYEAIVGEWANTSDLINEINILSSSGNFAIGTRVLVEGAGPDTPGGGGGVEDESVKLVVGDAIVGDERAKTGAWAELETVTYGAENDLHGQSLTPASFNDGGAGIAIQAAFTGDATAGIEYVLMRVAYSLPGGTEASTVLVELRADDETREVASLHGYRLPSDGLLAANDPRVEHAVAGAELRLSREYRPNRNVQKGWRSVEFFAALSPEVNIPGVQMWASIDDGDEFPLLDEDGSTLTVTSTGAHEAFLPTDAPASGSWIQVIPKVPDLAVGQQKVAVELRDITLHGSWLPKATDLIRAVVMLDNDTTTDPLTGQTTLSRVEVMRRLRRLRGPRAGNPVTLFDPELNEETHCVVVGVEYHRITETGEPRYTAVLTMRRTPFDATG